MPKEGGSNLWAPIRKYAKLLAETEDLIIIPLKQQYTAIIFYLFYVYFLLTDWKRGRKCENIAISLQYKKYIKNNADLLSKHK
jgi:hypothetical protein